MITLPIKMTQLMRLALLSAAVLLASCSDELSPDNVGDNKVPTGDFELRASVDDLQLTEGSESGVRIPLTLVRSNGHSASVQLSVSGASSADSAFINSNFTQTTLSAGNNASELQLQLDIADLPILPQEREFIILATDGTDSHSVEVQVNVTPVDAPDVYLLVGQSNMVGFSGDGTRQAFPGGADETNPRIKQLNVSKNDRQDIFLTQADFVSASKNVVAPGITTAEDPLHVPLDPSNTTGKDLEYIGLGLSFAKEALNETSRDIVLVPAAWSGSSFCKVEDGQDGPNGQWNAQPTTDPELGNTWLFDRAVARANLALAETGGILRGILWHQGESDSNERCAESYEQNLERLIFQMRMSIDADLRGGDLRRADSNIPFVIGTMSRGSDERGDLSDFPLSKQLVDNAHRELPGRIPFTALSDHEDLIPANGYPCGNTTCIHFGAAALREMGVRYHDALLRAAAGS
ncbi:sialate O-acetylesterase [Granulosicoccus sp. 3-233]